MKITLIDAGKRFNRDWIFRHLQYHFSPAHSYAIIGPNGSGKSTLLQAIAGAIAISEGSIHYEGSAAIAPDQAYKRLSLCAPYLEVVEEMTVTEFLHFHGSFKPLILPVPAIIEKVGLAAAAHKQIRYYSSGMKQRVRLAQALFSDTPVLLLDEPCTNLDSDGIALYRRLVAGHAANRLLIVSSNDLDEYDFCEEKIDIRDYK
ncbi:MAG TPA: ATP-binding cassette domain-containing protein [Puia sp.]|jgi:ABC-type multidrug transport system ATPase subunit|uniref:ABC transporter ATP-binding protein n=1 Tax=Puia sp. TaxID=2045100 RepID=UPI002B543A4A|nr:ATP-binding cassette domain-containing protein [Puia sp.]HVU99152.1 ATP-binding cassette domain-containing protein [Puia sp.]